VTITTASPKQSSSGYVEAHLARLEHMSSDIERSSVAPGASPKGMVAVPEGSFLMGSEDFYPEERPVHRVSVDGFLMDEHLVTVADFRRFVKETGYVTLAERAPDASQYPDADPDLLVPGSLVFRATTGPVDLRDVSNWWAYVPGASWRSPEGPGSTLHGRERHPVTHVAVEDAEAFALWSGKELPTEAEWEYAARGGLEGATFAWGDEFAPRGKMMANTWQGEFPWQNLKTDGFEGTSPVKRFAPNGYGLFDMTGNVWEWTSDYFSTFDNDGRHACCVPHNPRSASPEGSLVPDQPGAHIPRRVIKGGSHLCAPNYCLRYRPAARQSETTDTSTAHIGFRCIIR
jgi:formylglycine-generating enzyme required for sulfatase activity